MIMRKAGWRGGWSLVELTMAVMVLGVIGSVAAISFRSSVDRSRVRLAGSRLAADLRLVRSQAMADEAEHVLVVNAAGRSYAAPTVAALDNVGRIGVRLSGSPYHVTRLVAASPLEIAFDAEGRSSYEGDITMYCGGHSMVVRVEESGEVVEEE